jgi:hypothetical protein
MRSNHESPRIPRTFRATSSDLVVRFLLAARQFLSASHPDPRELGWFGPARWYHSRPVSGQFAIGNHPERILKLTLQLERIPDSLSSKIPEN